MIRCPSAGGPVDVCAQTCPGDRRAGRTHRLARSGIHPTIPPATGRGARRAQPDRGRVRRRGGAREPDARRGFGPARAKRRPLGPRPRRRHAQGDQSRQASQRADRGRELGRSADAPVRGRDQFRSSDRARRDRQLRARRASIVRRACGGRPRRPWGMGGDVPHRLAVPPRLPLRAARAQSQATYRRPLR
jgi:hypothetical protein